MERAYADGPAVAVEIAGTRPGRRKARASRHGSGDLALNGSPDTNASLDEAAHSKGMWDRLVDSFKEIAKRS